MANQYRLRRGASQGYYSNIAAIVAGDAQVRSESIRAQYGALSDGVASMFSSVASGFQAYYQYEANREKMLVEKQRAEVEVEKLKLQTELEQRKGRLELMNLEKQNKELEYSIQMREADSAIAPVKSYLLTTHLPMITQKVLNEADPGAAEKVFNAEMQGVRDTVLMQLYTTITDPAKRAVAEQRLFADRDVMTGMQNVASRLSDKKDKTLFVDPKTGLQYDYRTVDNALKSAEVDIDAKLAMISALNRDPKGARFPELQRARVAEEARLRKMTDDPVVQQKLLFYDVEREAAPLMAKFNSDVASGMDYSEAYKRLEEQFGIFKGTRTKPPAAELQAAQETIAFSAGADWDEAFNTNLRAPIRRGESRLGFVGGDDKDAEVAHQMAQTTLKKVVDSDVRTVLTAGSAQKVKDALTQLEAIRNDPLSVKDAVASKVDRSDWASRDLQSLTGRLRGAKAAVFGGYDMETQTVLALMKDADNGRDYLPSSLKSLDLANDPKGLSQLVSESSLSKEDLSLLQSYKVDRSKANYGSVLELVLDKRIADARSGRAPASIRSIIESAAAPGVGLLVKAGTRTLPAPLGLGAPASVAPAGSSSLVAPPRDMSGKK